MTYTAPDGHIMVASSTEVVSYTCSVEGVSDGIFYSVETYPAATEIGIQQMEIKRIVDNGSITIEITESTDAELLAYIEQCKQEQAQAQAQAQAQVVEEDINQLNP